MTIASELTRFEFQISELTRIEREHAKQKQTARTKFSERGDQRKNDERLIPHFDMARKEAAAQVDYDAAKAEEVLSVQQDKYSLNTPEDYQKVINHCREMQKSVVVNHHRLW